MVIVEKAFPRGGEVKPVAVTPEHKFGLSSISLKPKKKKTADKKKKKDAKKKVAKKDLTAKYAGTLTRKTIQDGMLLMGYVTNIEKTQLLVALPGKMRGAVEVTNISEPYTQALEKLLECHESGRSSESPTKLEDLFTIGQMVCCKVLGFPDKTLFKLSVNPKDIHSELGHSSLNEGMVLTGAVASWEDHGAVIDMGIANTRCFLPRSLKTAGLNVGQLVQCRIDTLTKTASTANVTLTVASEVKDRTVDLDIIQSVDNLLPTTQVQLTIMKNTLQSGLSGKILDGQFDGIIHEQHLGGAKKPSDFAVGQEVLATVLYVMPLTKFVFLTLNKFVPVEERLEQGSVLENVPVLTVHGSGVLLKLNKDSLGLISVKSMKGSEKSLDDLQRKYGSQVKQVRVLSYDPMDGVYFCTDDSKLIAEKFLRLGDVSVGQLVKCKVREPLKTQGILVKIGQLNGFIYKVHVEKTYLKAKAGATIAGRVIYIDEAKNSVHLTTRSEFIKADPQNDLLLDSKALHVGSDYLGMVTNVTPQRIFVEFFNRISGSLRNDASASRGGQNEYRIGAVLRFTVSKIQGDRITLEPCKQKVLHKVGEVVRGTVLGTFEAGVELEVAAGKKGKTTTVWVDKDFTSDFPELAAHMSVSLRKGEPMSAVAVSKSHYSIRDVEPFQRYPLLERTKLSPGKLLRAFVQRVDEVGISVSVPLVGATESAKIPFASVLMNAEVENKEKLIAPNQVVLVKVTAPVYKSTRNIPLCARLDSTWSGNGYGTINYLKDYFAQLQKVQEPMFKANNFSWSVGSKVNGEVLKVVKAGAEYEIQFGGKFKGHLKTAANLSVKEAVKCVIVWVDESGSIFLSNDERVLNVEGEPTAIAFTNQKENGYIVHETKYCYVVLLEKARNYVYVPVRLHYNDFQPLLVDMKGTCRLVVMHTNGDRKIALFAHVYDRMVALGMKVQDPKKHSLEIKEEPVDAEEEDEEEDEEVEEPQKKKQKKETVVEAEKTVEAVPVLPKKRKEIVPKMVGNPVVIDEKEAMSDFWKMDFGTVQSKMLSADFEMDLDDDEESATKSQKPKQGPSETDIRNMEEALAASSNIPSSTAEFERLVLATPNNSLIWIKFMVFHLQALEVDKARHVFRRALKSINFRWQDDILNVWVAYLNLELRYGTPESFEEAFSEALATNDQFKISVRTIEILADSQKTAMCKAKATIAMKKFKDRAELWPKVGAAYFALGLKEEANQLVNKALAALDKRDHLQVIVEFAKLNRANGQMDVASTLLEQILTSYPKRTDIWSFYVDMLVKENQLDSARGILERATSQKLPVKKMKTLFKKYLEFEERFGDENSVAHVKQMAAEYVQSQQ